MALADRGAPGALELTTNDGTVSVSVAIGPDGPVATLTSVATWVKAAPSELLTSSLGLLGWDPDELDGALPPAIAFAGARHLVIAVRKLATLARLTYPFEAMGALMREHDLTTLQLVWREGPALFRARDPFPVGGVVEDPATGAAAAALGAYLRDRGEITPPAMFEIIQGVEMGRPSRIGIHRARRARRTGHGDRSPDLTRPGQSRSSVRSAALTRSSKEEPTARFASAARDASRASPSE